jgi:hypothetical protein
MKITIRHRYTKEVLYETEEVETLRQAVEKANLEGADLFGADLSGADLSGADLSRAYLSGAYLFGADLSGADLSRANLSRAYLSRAYLSRANLSGADLSGAKGYQDSHDIFLELVRREKIDTITEEEWGIVGLLSIHRPCWDTIKKRFGEKIMPIFKRLADNGFSEYADHYEKVLKEEK